MSIEERVWRAADGREIHLEQMELNHIYNTILYLRRELVDVKHVCSASFDERCYVCDMGEPVGRPKAAWIRAFQVELMRRGEPVEPDMVKLEAANKAWDEAQQRRLNIPSTCRACGTNCGADCGGSIQ